MNSWYITLDHVESKSFLMNTLVTHPVGNSLLYEHKRIQEPLIEVARAVDVLIVAMAAGLVDLRSQR